MNQARPPGHSGHEKARDRRVRWFSAFQSIAPPRGTRAQAEGPVPRRGLILKGKFVQVLKVVIGQAEVC